MPQPFQIAVLEEEYEAFVTIKRKRVTKKANGNGYFDDPAKDDSRLMVDLKLTSTSLEGIKLKIKQHIDLTEDE